MKFAHINIVCKDAKRIADFYIRVFECVKQIPETKLIGEWVIKGTGVKNAEIQSIVLDLPGFKNEGPKLEVFQYNESENHGMQSKSNAQGFGHLAFQVDDVLEVLNKAIENGGSQIGKLVNKEFQRGTITFVYATDPEGNIVEIMNWRAK